ncbi:MAG: hypothetical protein ACFFAQ_07890 [Promethearchaeota archaeon]
MALVAGILALISILTPWGSLDVGGGVTAYSWLGGAVVYYADMPSPYPEWQGTGASLWTFAIVILATTLLLFVSINTWRGKEFKWDWLMYLLCGIGLIIFPILALVFEATEDAVIGFAPIGLIIAGCIAIVAFVFDKFMSK